MLTLKDVLSDGSQDKEKYKISADNHLEDEHIELLDQCRRYYDNLRGVREDYIRNRKFVSGDQFSDFVDDPENPGNMISERQLILAQGRQPIVNNQIQKIVRTMLGQFRDNDYKPLVMSRSKENAETTEMMTNALQYIYDNEELGELDSREFEEFLKHAMPGYKVDWGWNPKLQDYGMNIDLLNIHRVFFNTDVEDIRMKDLKVIGEIHDMLPKEVISTFGKGNKEKEEIIKTWIGGDGASNYGYDGQFDSRQFDSMDFLTPEDVNKVRIIEVWQKKMELRALCHDYLTGESYIHPLSLKEAEVSISIDNEERAQLYFDQGISEEDAPLIDISPEEVPIWHYHYFTVQGHCLDKGETPFDHNEHPYILRPYPMSNREVSPFISTVIDQQKYINRLITMMDFMLGAGAKGVLLIDEKMLPDGTSLKDVANKWKKFNGVIALDMKPGVEMPKQIYSNSQSAAGEKMLGLQLQLFKEISGVNDAIQGQKVSGVNTASQYAQMTSNATLSSKDYFEHFSNVRRVRDRKIVSVFQQYWDQERYINVSGSDYENEAYMYDPEKAKDGIYDVVIAKGGNSPVYRAQMDDYLMQMLQNQQIDLPLFLEHTSLPFAQKLSQSLQERQQGGMNGVREALADPQAQQIMNNVDPQTQALMNQAMGR